MKKFWQTALALLLAAALWMVPVLAFGHEVPDMDKKGSITVELKYGTKVVKGGALRLFKVGKVAEDDGNYSFEWEDALAGFSGELTLPDDGTLAKSLYSYVRSAKVTAVITLTNKTGTVVFENLEPGLYLVAQPKAASGYTALAPFLVSVPTYQEGHYIYDVSAYGKSSLKPAGTPGPTPEPSLPQTGQLSWPVPVLTVAGLLLFAFGWWLCFGRRKKEHGA